jgi:hypothetical protein
MRMPTGAPLRHQRPKTCVFCCGLEYLGRQNTTLHFFLVLHIDVHNIASPMLQTGHNNSSNGDERNAKVIIFDWDDTICPSSYFDRQEIERANELPVRVRLGCCPTWESDDDIFGRRPCIRWRSRVSKHVSFSRFGSF